MSLIERIQKDLTEAMKSEGRAGLSVLRMVKSALKNKEIEKIRPLDEAESYGPGKRSSKKQGID